jgi:hypothetical protein
MPGGMRLAYTFVLLVALTSLIGCTRHSLTYPDGGDPCSALGVSDCNSNPSCELIVPCFCGTNPPSPNTCVTKGTRFPCPLCATCVGLSESDCKLASNTCRADYCDECQCTPSFVGCVAKNAPPTVCMARGCDPAPSCSCDNLDENSCSARSNCTTNYCVGCDGVQRFSGCTGPGETAPACSNSCDCRSGSDCNGEICVVPGGSAGCGVCQFPQSCLKDSDCSAGTVCDTAACSCTGGKACVPACTSGSCSVGETCGSDGHCAAQACSSPAQCPAFFDCVLLNGSSRCERRACTGDSGCNGGYCVDGGCYGSLGSCQWPNP